MQTKILFRITLLSLGIALLFAGLFFDNGRAGPLAQATPTRDRLAEPTLPPAPSQADRGAQVYWLSCLPCHGDFGQGLTDEFRAAYPEEDRNCWDSGCHGERPYDNGFKLPKSIPAVVGPGTLQKYADASILQAYIRVAMPFWKPGSLTEEEAWSVTAFVLRQNGLWDERVELNESNAGQVRVGAVAAPTPTSTPTPAKTEPDGDGGASIQVAWPVILGGVLLLALTLFFILSPKKSSQ
ncbi:MAG: c-type cytochrome [Chloroflexi bacterium]|nr:c-type cytochrome [Chloroflexota bacterium]